MAGADEVPDDRTGTSGAGRRVSLPDRRRAQKLRRTAADSSRTPRSRTVRSKAAGALRRLVPEPSSGALWGEATGEPRLVSSGGVAVDDAFAGELVDQRNRLTQCRFRS